MKTYQNPLPPSDLACLLVMIAVIIFVVAFKNSSNLTNAYG